MRFANRLFAVFVCLAAPVPSGADSSLRYRLNGTDFVQSIVIKEGRILMPGLDATDRRDFLFDRTRREAVLIDHKKRSFVKVDDGTIERLSRQSEPLQPLIAGIGAQLGKLSPEQRAKWQEMLGGVDLDKLASATNAAMPTHVAKDQGHGKAGGFACDRITVLRGKAKVAQLCVSQAEVLGLPSDDYATARALFDFAEHVAIKTKGLSGLMGFSMPLISVQEIPGIPVEIRDLSGQRGDTVTLAEIGPVGGETFSMDVPAGYRSEQLKLW